MEEVAGMTKIKSICPNCGKLAEVMASMSPEYSLIECHNIIEKVVNKGKITQYTEKIACGFRQFVKVNK